MPFTELPHTGDLRYRATGNSEEEALAESVCALFSTVTDLEAIQPIESRTLDVSASDGARLLVDLLREALSLFDTDGFVARYCRVTLIDGERERVAHAVLTGERFDPARHPYRTEVKGVTYHAAEIHRTAQGWETSFTLDL